MNVFLNISVLYLQSSEHHSDERVTSLLKGISGNKYSVSIYTYREYVYSVAVYQKYLTWFGELITVRAMARKLSILPTE